MNNNYRPGNAGKNDPISGNQQTKEHEEFLSDYYRYRSVGWWLKATFWTLRFYLHKPRYQIDALREQERIAGDTNTFAPRLYEILSSKYSEFSWIEKYIHSDHAYCVSELSAPLMTFVGLESIWTYQATTDLLAPLIRDFNADVEIRIRLRSGTPHVVLLAGVDDEHRKVMISDPLGDYNSRYMLKYPRYPLSFERLEQIAMGDPLTITARILPEQMDRARSLFKGITYYYFTKDEVVEIVKRLGVIVLPIKPLKR